MPPSARWLGAAGLIPFFAAALAGWAAPAGLRGIALFALASYGMVILSFLGAVHWGLALRAPQAEARFATARLGLGVLPALLGWVALMLPPALGLGTLAAGILATAAVETLAARHGLVPAEYIRLRWPLSLGAALSLMAGAIAAMG